MSVPSPHYTRKTGVTLERHYTNADHLLDDFFKAACVSGDDMYRGISRDNERYPNIMRVWTGTGYQSIHYTKEIPMLKAFRKHAASLMEANYSAIDFVSCAQHFGVPTRLLDWTTNPFVALFFALSAKVPQSDDKAFSYRVMVCDKSRQLVFDDIYTNPTNAEAANVASDSRIRAFESFTTAIRRDENLKSICDACKIEYTAESQNGFIVLEANNANPRISAQKGLFVIPRQRSIRRIEQEYREAGVRTITIAPNIRDEVLDRLERLGYSRVHLFFDLQNIAAHIREQALGEE